MLLILYRCHITQDFLACLYRVDKATICRSLKRIETVACRVPGVKRRIAVTAEEAQDLILVCTEQPVQRPSHKQRCWYSGKKKRHTVKNEVIRTAKGRIVSISKDAPGRVHDIEVRRGADRRCQKTPMPMPTAAIKAIRKTTKPSKSPINPSKKKPLAKDERHYNQALSRFRVRIEHSIGRFNVFRILSDRYRYPRTGHAVKLGIVAGIVNLVTQS